MAKEKSVKRTTVATPQSIEEVAEFVRKIGEHQRAVTRIETICNEKIERAKEQAMENSAPHEEAKDKLFEGIFIYSQSHRDELTEQGKTKTVQLPTGDIYWRMTPPSVSIRNAEKVIEFCESKELLQFIRIKREVDKQAILKDQERAGKIPGVKIDQREEFGVKPSETQIEISKETTKLQKVLSKK